MARLGSYPRKPRAHRSVGREIEAAIARDVRVGVQRDVRDAIALAREKKPPGEMGFHDPQGIAAPRQALRQFAATRAVGGQMANDEAWRRDVRLMAVLLKKHPLQDLRARQAPLGYERRAFCEIPENRIGLGEVLSVVEFKERNAAVRILGEKLRRARLAFHDIDFMIAIGYTQLR